MINSTLKRTGLAALLGFAMAFGASAQTFLYEGICYKATGDKLQVQKLTGTKLPTPENGDLPANYSGDIVIPEQIVYNGTTYTVTDLSTGFKEQPITSITMPASVIKIGAGGFQNCTQLTSVTLSPGVVKLEQNLFNGCVALTEISIPGTVTSMGNALFKGCVNLSKLTIEDGPTALGMKATLFPEGANAGLTELNIFRALDNSISTAMADKPFRGAPALATVTLGGSYVNIEPSMFEGCRALATLNITGDVNVMGTNAFAGTALTSVVLPNSLTAIPSGAFSGTTALADVTLGNAVTAIDALAFQNSGVANINFPETLETIGDMAFSGAKLGGNLVMPAGLKKIGAQAFARNLFTSISLPATVNRIGDGAFMGCANLATFSVAAENETYQTTADGTALEEKNNSRLVAYAPMAPATSVVFNHQEVAPYAMYGASNLEAITLPAATTVGDYALAYTGVKTLDFGATGIFGRYVASNNQALTSVAITTPEVPVGLIANCPNVTDVTLPAAITVVKQDAFKNCTSLTSLNLGNILAILEADCFAGSGITNLTVGSTFPAAMAEGVFPAGCGITATVPADLAEIYRNADGWRNLTIVGDANLVAGGADMGMPAGLYYAGDDDMLHCVYASGEADSYDVGGIPHTFQLIEFQNRIYGASAGKKFIYSATGATDGDGKLFYISQVGGNTFQAVVLDNAGNNAYKDPFGLYIYGSDLYVNDRNVCIRKIPASAIALPQDYPSWMENNWMYFYGAPWSYGCIKCGFAITSVKDAAGMDEPLYWVGMKYNGEGLFRFRNKNVGTGSDVDTKGSQPAEAPMLTSIAPIFTTFNVDQENGHLYLYIEIANKNNSELRVPAGLYRVNLADIEANPDPSDFFALNPVLIDGAPVKYEGGGANEHVGISQLAFDAEHKYMYWCYRAPTPEEAASTEAQSELDMLAGHYYWATPYDESNPLHHSGIKRILLGQENPEVEMVAPGVSGYGVVPVNFEGSARPSGVNTVVAPEAQIVSYMGGQILAADAANVAVYDATGLMVANVALLAGEAFDMANLPAGLYIVAANTAVATQTLKVIR